MRRALLTVTCALLNLIFQLQELSFIQISQSGGLTIIGTQEVDGGEYECVASNDAGSATETLTLEVGCERFI